MIVIVDCNEFYAACHRLFQAYLWNKPVVVLSNNEGVVVSLNKAAKRIGAKRGMVHFQNKEFFRKNGIIAFPSNYELYDDISDRVIFSIAEFLELVEVYSIDEVFGSLKGYEHFGYVEYCRTIVAAVKRNVGIDVSMGIAVNKTLAKIANRFSKKIERFNGVFMIDTDEKRIECLKRTEIGDVWGIGPELAEALNVQGIFTAYDFITKVSRQGARKLHNVELERSWCELNGIKCYDIIPVAPYKKTLATTRSFMSEIMDIQGLKEAVSTYAAICGSHLRRQDAYAASIKVLLLTNRHKNVPQYNPYREIDLPFPSNTSHSLIKHSLQCLDDMFIDGFRYKKAGVIITKIVRNVQPDIFIPTTLDDKFRKISPIEDFYAHGFDRRLLSVGIMGYGKNQRKDKKMRGEEKNRRYTTDFRQILEIDCTV